MAADGVNNLRVVIVHGVAKHDLTLKLAKSESGDILTLAHLAKEVEKLTLVPLKQQKLIFKGKHLSNPSEGLSKLGIKHGDRIMLLGRAYIPEDDENWKVVDNIRSQLKGTSKKLSSIILESDGLHKGFVARTAEAEVLCRLRRRMFAVVGELEKLLQSLDALQLAESGKELRERRKCSVTEIQKTLERCDNLQAGLNDMSVKTDRNTEKIG